MADRLMTGKKEIRIDHALEETVKAKAEKLRQQAIDGLKELDELEVEIVRLKVGDK
jgi:hypothetical protein